MKLTAYRLRNTFNYHVPTGYSLRISVICPPLIPKWVIRASTYVLFCSLFFMVPSLAFAQEVRQFIKMDSLFIAYVPGTCKSLHPSIIIKIPAVLRVNPQTLAQVKSSSLGKVHLNGSANYQFLHQSFIDTPFAMAPLNQHSIQTSFQVHLLDKFPLRVNMWYRWSNSIYRRNALDVSVQWDKAAWLAQQRSGVEQKIKDLERSLSNHSYEKEMVQVMDRKSRITNWFSSDEARQRVAEASRRKIQSEKASIPLLSRDLSAIKDFDFSKINIEGATTGNKKFNIPSAAIPDRTSPLPGMDSLAVDSAYQSRLNALDSLNNRAVAITQLIDSIKPAQQRQLSRLKDSLQSFAAGRFKGKKAGSNGDFLSRLNALDLGRFTINASELTVREICISGINIEISPSRFYFRVAAGKMNFRFREFLMRDDIASNQQQLFLFRVGHGNSERKNLLFSVYGGRKAVGSYVNQSWTSVYQPVLGYSIEKNIELNSFNRLTVELAKSSYPSRSVKKDIVAFTDRSNEAYSIKLVGEVPAVKLSYSASVKRLNENFQSFNLLPHGVRQNAWEIKARKSFFRNTLIINSFLKNFSYIHPLVSSAPSVRTIFGSTLLTFRKRKLPVISVGFIPSQQLVYDNGNWKQFDYNNWMGSASHFYKIGSVWVSSSFSLFFAKSTSDTTGFLPFRSRNISFNQTADLGKLHLNSGVNFVSQENLRILTLDQQLNYNFSSDFALNGGAKMVKDLHAGWKYGYSAGATIKIFQNISCHINIDRSFLPSMSGGVLPLQTGRAGVVKSF